MWYSPVSHQYSSISKNAPPRVEMAKKPLFCDFSGSLSLGVSYSFAHDAPEPNKTDYRGLSRLRPDFHLDLDLTFSENWKALISGRTFYDFAYKINGRDNYTGEVLEEYEKEAEFGELKEYCDELVTMNEEERDEVWDASENMFFMKDDDIPSGTDLSGLGEKIFRLRANLTTSDPAVTPVLHDWSVTYTDAARQSEWSNVISSSPKPKSK